MSMILNKHY